MKNQQENVYFWKNGAKMSLSEWYYLPVAALINSLFTVFWQTKWNQKKIQGYGLWIVIFLGSLFSAWGIDVIQRMVDATDLVHIMKISLGCWLFIAVATSAKHYAIKGWSKKSFWIDYGGDLIGFILTGLVIHILT